MARTTWLAVLHPPGRQRRGDDPLAINSRSGGGDYAWSPDGTRIVFLLFGQVGSGTFEEGIATTKADGSDVQLVTISPTFDHQADWGAHPLVPKSTGRRPSAESPPRRALSLLGARLESPMENSARD
jgi:hypothetical protein